MNCRRALRDLQPLLDGALRDADALAVRAHLASCRRCSARWLVLQAVERSLASEPPLDPPAGLAPHIVQQAVAQALLRRRLLVPAWLEMTTLAGLTGALAALAAITVEVLGGSAALGLTLRQSVAVIATTAALGLAGFSALYYRPQ